MAKKTRNFELDKQTAHEKESSAQKVYLATGNQNPALEEEKEILNRAIDAADELFSTDIRKKCLPLSLHLTKSKGPQEKPEA